MSVSVLAAKLLILLGQVVLAWFLTQEEFGILAIVAAAAACIKIFHDGGVPQVIVQRGGEEFERLQGAVFWIGFLVSLAGGILLAAAASWIAAFYGEARLAPLFWVLAVTLPLGAPASTLRAKMQIDLRFREISILNIANGVIRCIGMILLAWFGFGLMCYVLPLLATAVFAVAYTYRATRVSPWTRSPDFSQWPGLLADSYWVVFGTVAKAVSRNGDYLVLGRMLPKAIVGPYFFAYMLTMQITSLIGLNLRRVLYPVMTKFTDQPQRQASALLRSIRVLALIAAGGCMLIAVVIGPLATVMQREIWESAVPLVRIFAVAAPILMLTDVTHAALHARGQFRASGLLTLGEAIWFTGSSYLAATVAGANITSVTAIIFGLQILFALAVNGLATRSFGIKTRQLARSFVPQWLVAAASAVVAMLTLRLLPAGAPAVIELVLAAVVYLATFATLVRTMLSSDLQQFVTSAPLPIANVVRRVFRLPRLEN